MENNVSFLDNLLLKSNISTKSPFIRLIATIFTIAVLLLFINAHMDGVISKKEIRNIESKFETKDIFIMKQVATSCMELGVNPRNTDEMFSCVEHHKEEMIQPLQSTLTASRFKRVFIFIFASGLLTMYFLLLRYKYKLTHAKENTNA